MYSPYFPMKSTYSDQQSLKNLDTFVIAVFSFRMFCIRNTLFLLTMVMVLHTEEDYMP